MGVKKFSAPLPPSKFPRQTPQNYVIMLAFMSSTNPENLVKGCLPVFFIGPFENMGLQYEQ